MAQLHDLGFEIFHRRVGAAVLASGFRVGGSVHVGQQRHIFDPQTVDDDMHMDVAGLVMPVRVGADDRLMTGKLLPAKPNINDWHNPYPQLAAEVRAATSDLAALKFEVLEKVGEAVGNAQTYQL